MGGWVVGVVESAVPSTDLKSSCVPNFLTMIDHDDHEKNQ